jgi:SAM-dependent methyltransferase
MPTRRDSSRLSGGSRLGSRLRAAMRRLLQARGAPSDDIAQWERRARQFGARAVVNLDHSESDLERVTAGQKEELYPLFSEHIRVDDRLVVDLGCGTGRFTPDLAWMTNGQALGLDPIQELLDMAPAAPAVEYRRMSEGRIPLDDREADAIWICLVLGGLCDAVLRATIGEVKRVLRPGGLLFLVENTTDAADDGDIWHFRSVATYQDLFRPIPLTHVHDYDDLGERISVFVGRSAI